MTSAQFAKQAKIGISKALIYLRAARKRGAIEVFTGTVSIAIGEVRRMTWYRPIAVRK